ncbi:hypothetical protein BJ508DRAFT_144713 [Ascobolus immersus RN42]|uniref:Uncharacterized protein n=1 Tax=Ascobolus immersus RN42 TaxID=1160509 RepID=A0A3N4IBT9_ASCIM|nr:hypothetical protein BJ508DRAFT_144713 [Ascobolus immersus RN42]
MNLLPTNLLYSYSLVGCPAEVCPVMPGDEAKVSYLPGSFFLQGSVVVVLLLHFCVDVLGIGIENLKMKRGGSLGLTIPFVAFVYPSLYYFSVLISCLLSLDLFFFLFWGSLMGFFFLASLNKALFLFSKTILVLCILVALVMAFGVV